MTRTHKTAIAVIVLALVLGAVIFAIVRVIEVLQRPSALSLVNIDVAQQVEMQVIRNRIEEVNADAATAMKLIMQQMTYMSAQIDRLAILEGYRQHRERKMQEGETVTPDPTTQRYGL